MAETTGNGSLPLPLALFETKTAKGRLLFRLYATVMATAICFIFFYRLKRHPHAPTTNGQEDGRFPFPWSWIGIAMFMAEVWFTLYWLINQIIRWNPVRHYTFKHRLSSRYDKVLPGVDIFVCTADPLLEPPILVVNTVLSLMAYDYPPHKLNLYLSDDAASELVFYALLEALSFSKYWLPFCKRHNIEPRSPSAYFASATLPPPSAPAHEFFIIKNKYEEIKGRIESTTKQGFVPQELRKEHKGYQEWDTSTTLASTSNKHDHQPILQILANQGDLKAIDVEGNTLPTLVYLAREKRPGFHHNFKAGAMNSLIRVSSRISNSPIILNVDCDMYSNNSESVRDALCFFMDEQRSHQIAFVQFPQNYNNLTRNDIYANALLVLNEVDMGGVDSNGGMLYIGSGCFHRRDTLCGRIYSNNTRIDWEKENQRNASHHEGVDVLEKECKVLASCSYEQNTEWGKEMGLKYGCPAEDVITGLAIKCRGWRSVHFNPERKGFLGLAPTTLLDTLIQQKRWSEGDFQIFLSKYCPFIYGHGRIPLKLQISYCCYLLWAANCWATLCYVAVPSYCLLRSISLFPELSSYWFLPFACVFLGRQAYSLGEFRSYGGTIKGWWNDQRMWMYKRLTSYLFAFCDVVLKSMNFTTTGFIITSKVFEEGAARRYDKELLEFGSTSPMFTILSTLALVNLFSFLIGLKRVIMDSNTKFFSQFAAQMVLCGLITLINLPLYQGLFFRKDKGRMPSSTTLQSILFASFYCTLALV